MAGVSRGSAVRHAVLVSGADDELVYFVDPHPGVESSLPISSFYNSWLLSGGDMLVVEDVL